MKKEIKIGGDRSKRTAHYGRDSEGKIIEGNLCRMFSFCPDIKKMKKSIEEKIPHEELIEQYEEVCSHAGGSEIRRISCLLYNGFERVLGPYRRYPTAEDYQKITEMRK